MPTHTEKHAQILSDFSDREYRQKFISFSNDFIKVPLNQPGIYLTLLEPTSLQEATERQKESRKLQPIINHIRKSLGTDLNKILEYFIAINCELESRKNH